MFRRWGDERYAIIAILETIQKKAGRNLLDRFDLVGGTSVGGIAALICNRVDSFESGHVIMRDIIDDVREASFEGLKTVSNVIRLVTTGSLLHKDKQIIETIKKRYPEESLLNLEGVPAFVVTAKKRKQNINDEEVEFEPFILRSYHHPDEIKTKSHNINNHHITLADSTSSVSLCEAMAATSAVPPLVDRVNVNVNGDEIMLGDGALISNCPVVHALDEASRLYPNRPIGVILSIGFTKNENESVHRAVDVMRMSSPALHFQRITPYEIMEPFKCEEADLSKIAIMEAQVKEYMRENLQVVNSLHITIERLFASSQPRKVSNDIIQNTLKMHRDILKSSSYERRQSRRQQSTRHIQDKNNETWHDNVDASASKTASGSAFVKNPTNVKKTGNKGCRFFYTRKRSNIFCTRNQSEFVQSNQKEALH